MTWKPNTSKPRKRHKIYLYLLRGLRVDRPGQVWCADITLASSLEPVAFACSAADAARLPVSRRHQDWFTRKVLAWRISNTLEADFCIEALNEAILRFGAPGIMNTDQGSQFTSFAWTDRLKRVGTRISMDGKGCCIDNVFIDRLWRSLKYECVYLRAWETGSQAKAAIGSWITFYNHRRPHTAHGGQPPAVVCFNSIETDQQAQAVA
ncbi:IS3 family transposase [Gemmobacter sp. 24YEA27]|uniref:IS3 family transposase n=1 Tax=Gemmobacter sp. 24YEA27 TaxID=3040672 RepID=UPI0024B37696|nr:IS3 family transposase [Gemmobacter sp. 24YEA27]